MSAGVAVSFACEKKNTGLLVPARRGMQGGRREGALARVCPRRPQDRCQGRAQVKPLLVLVLVLLASDAALRQALLS